MEKSRTRGQGTTTIQRHAFQLCLVRRRTNAIDLCTNDPLGFGGADRDRTDDLKLAKLALSQLSYGPWDKTSKNDRRSNGGPGTS